MAHNYRTSLFLSLECLSYFIVFILFYSIVVYLNLLCFSNLLGEISLSDMKCDDSLELQCSMNSKAECLELTYRRDVPFYVARSWFQDEVEAEGQDCSWLCLILMCILPHSQLLFLKTCRQGGGVERKEIDWPCHYLAFQSLTVLHTGFPSVWAC